MRSAKDFFQPLALGAPEPLREVPFRPSRMIHFFDPSNPKMAATVPDIADFGNCQLWTRINSLDSPWALDDVTRLVGEIGDKLDVIMIPKVEGAWDIHYMDRLVAQLEARAGLKRPILFHAILETATGVANVEEICGASPRMQGLSLGPADLAASRRMKTTRVGGGHPGYIVRADPDAANEDAPRPTAMTQDSFRSWWR